MARQTFAARTVRMLPTGCWTRPARRRRQRIQAPGGDRPRRDRRARSAVLARRRATRPRPGWPLPVRRARSGSRSGPPSRSATRRDGSAAADGGPGRGTRRSRHGPNRPWHLPHRLPAQSPRPPSHAQRASGLTRPSGRSKASRR